MRISQEVHPIDESFFEGAVSIATGDGWMQPLRLPCNKLPLFNEELVDRASVTAGVRVRFRTDATAPGLRIRPLPDDAAPTTFDCVIANSRVATVTVANDADEVRFPGLPPGEKTIEIWLPTFRTVAVRGIVTEQGASVAGAPDSRFRWVTYGSSITMCRTAHSPTRTWPATVALARDWNLTCLGYGGQCHLEPLVARVISELPADFISLKLGINVCGNASLNARSFRSAVIGMVKMIRERQPGTPLLLISPIISPPRETATNVVGMSLAFMRAEIAEAHRLLVADGDRHLSYADGLELFGADLIGPRLPDDLHPDGDGYEIMGRRFLDRILPRVPGLPAR